MNARLSSLKGVRFCALPINDLALGINCDFSLLDKNPADHLLHRFKKKQHASDCRHTSRRVIALWQAIVPHLHGLRDSRSMGPR